MPRRASLIVFLGLVVALILVTGISAGAEPDGGVRSKEAEVASAQERLMEIRWEESNALAEYNIALDKMNELNGEIADAEKDLQAAEEDLAEAQAALEERASQIYRSGNVGFVDVLVGVDNFSEFASRLDLWMRLLEEERAAYEAVLAAKNDLEERKSALETERVRRVEAVEKAMDQKKQVAEAEAEAEDYLNSLNADLQEAIQAEQERQAAELARQAAAAEPEPEPEPEPVQVEVPQPDLEAQQRAAAREAAAQEAAEEAQRQAELAEEEAAAAERAALAEQREEERAEKRAAAQAAREEAQRQAELAAIEQAAAEQAAAEQAAAERRAERRAAAREAAAAEELAAERRAERRAAAEQAAAELAAERRAERRAAAREAAAAEELAAEREAKREELAAQRAEERALEEASASASAPAEEKKDDPASASASASATISGEGAVSSCGTDFGGVHDHVAEAGCDLQEKFGLRVTGIGYSDYHWDGMDLDIWTSDVALGNQVRDYALANYDVQYTCWQDLYVNYATGWEESCPGHMDHVHITFN